MYKENGREYLFFIYATKYCVDSGVKNDKIKQGEYDSSYLLTLVLSGKYSSESRPSRQIIFLYLYEGVMVHHVLICCLFKQPQLLCNVQIHHQYVHGFFPENTEKLTLHIHFDDILQCFLR